MEIVFFYRIMRKIISHKGDCSVARFIWVNICPWVSNVSSLSVPPWKKFNHVFNMAKIKGSVQFLLHIKVQSFGACLVCCRLTWPLDLHGCVCSQVRNVLTNGASVGQRERERTR